MDDTRKFFDLLFDPTEVIGFCCLKTKWGTVTGFYDGENRERLIDAISQFDGIADCYTNANRLNPDVLGRYNNRFQRYDKFRWSDADIIRRSRFFVDLDPVRLSGINSTDDELRHAFDLAHEVRPYLAHECGLQPVQVCSGNGVQLVAKIDEPVDSDKPSKLIKHLANKFTNRYVKVDTSVTDPARLMRLPGTMNLKGDHLPHRPRRRAYLMEVGQ
jgi:hypothetical protein